MKVLVISDTHGNIDQVRDLLDMLKNSEVKVVLHCGDYISDARLIQKFYPDLEVHGVYGNCDVGFGGEYSTVVTLEGVAIYMTHGHRYGVKWGEYDELAIDASAHDAAVAVCGHSHQAYLEQMDDVLVMNPGSMTLPRDSKWPSYGILEVEDGEVRNASVMQVMQDGIIRQHPISKYFQIGEE